MQWLKDYRIEKGINGEVFVIIYLNEKDTEFADSQGHLKKEKEKDLFTQIEGFVKHQLGHLKVSGIKIVLGGLLLATLPLSGAYANTTYTVQYGDTLYKIAQTYNTTIDALKNANGLSSDMIYVGQSLTIPSSSSGSYYVKYGDTLYKIAEAYGTTVDAIKSANQLTSDMIYVGQELIIGNEQSSVSTHQVVSGDTLWKIANQYGTDVATLKSLNNLSSDTIYIGQSLVLPSVTNDNEATETPSITYVSHTVQSGENPWQIALDYGIPVSEVLEANQLTEDSSLTIGQVLSIPVHHIPVKETLGENYGELLDWWTEAQYVFATNDIAEVIDLETGISFNIQRTTGAFHADSEPLTAEDTAIAKSIWGGYSWESRPVLIVVDGRKIAASMSFMPHDVEYITDNDFDGHFDVHFLNSTRHVDNEMDATHQYNVKVAAGIIQS